jgi:hypothetical protein
MSCAACAPPTCWSAICRSGTCRSAPVARRPVFRPPVSRPPVSRESRRGRGDRERALRGRRCAPREWVGPGGAAVAERLESHDHRGDRDDENQEGHTATSLARRNHADGSKRPGGERRSARLPPDLAELMASRGDASRPEPIHAGDARPPDPAATDPDIVATRRHRTTSYLGDGGSGTTSALASGAGKAPRTENSVAHPVSSSTPQ